MPVISYCHRKQHTGNTHMAKYLILATILLGIAACGDTWGQRAATGGAIGTGAGLAIGALAGWPLLGPALAGAVVGAGIGAATSKDGPMASK